VISDGLVNVIDFPRPTVLVGGVFKVAVTSLNFVT
jgi:hypothetical protein